MLAGAAVTSFHELISTRMVRHVLYSSYCEAGTTETDLSNGGSVTP